MKNIFFFFLLSFSVPAFSLTCVPAVSQWGTISYISLNVTVCPSTDWAVFTPADLIAHDAAVAAAAVAAAAGGVATVPAATSYNPAAFTSGIEFGAAAAGLMLTAWGFVAIRRLLH